MIDGIVSGKLLFKPKMLKTKRGSDYLIAKMLVYGYQAGNISVKPTHGDLIAFDMAVCRSLWALEAGAVITVCGVIVPVREVYWGQEETILKITVHGVLFDYASGQTMGKGGLFGLLKQAGWLMSVSGGG